MQWNSAKISSTSSTALYGCRRSAVLRRKNPLWPRQTCKLRRMHMHTSGQYVKYVFCDGPQISLSQYICYRAGKRSLACANIITRRASIMVARDRHGITTISRYARPDYCPIYAINSRVWCTQSSDHYRKISTRVITCVN